MTQQQIAYMNAQTSRRQLEYTKKSAEAAERQSLAAMKQAEANQQKTNWDTGEGFWWGVGTGALATVGGIIALLLL